MDTKSTQTEEVDAYMRQFSHPLKAVMGALREVTMTTNKNIGEEVKWNAPTFFYTGPMKPSDPKKYLRYLIVSNVHRKEFIMLVLPHGAGADDGSGFLEGQYADGRRLLKFYNLEDVEDKKVRLQRVVRILLESMKE